MNVLIVALGAVVPQEVSQEADVLVVAPALNSKLRHWVSDEDDARQRAKTLADALVALLKLNGVRAEGQTGDRDPLQAATDALWTFRADEIVIAGRPPRSNRLDRLAARMRDRFAIPVRAAHSLASAA